VIVLLDALNTPVQDQSRARLEMLKYLDKQLQPASRSPSTPWHDR